MKNKKAEIKYIPLGGGVHLNYSNARSPLGTLLSKIVDDKDYTQVNALFDHIMEGSTGKTAPTNDDTLMTLSTLKESENWVTDKGIDDQGMHYWYSECVIGDVVNSIVTYETVPMNFKDKMPKDATATTYTRIYTFNNNTKFATSYGFIHYTLEAVLPAIGLVVLKAVGGKMMAGAGRLWNRIRNGENPEMDAADADAIGEAGEAAAGEEAGVEVNIVVDENLLAEGVGEGLIEAGVADMALGPLGLLLFVATIVVIAVIALILWILSYIDRAFVSRVLIFNATKTSVTLNARYFDNVNTDPNNLPGILNEHSAVTKILPPVYNRVPPMPPSSLVSSSEKSSKRPTFDHTTLEDASKQASINYALYSVVNSKKIIEGMGTLISLDPYNEKGDTPTYSDFENVFYQNRSEERRVGKECCR